MMLLCVRCPNSDECFYFNWIWMNESKTNCASENKQRCSNLPTKTQVITKFKSNLHLETKDIKDDEKQSQKNGQHKSYYCLLFQSICLTLTFSHMRSMLFHPTLIFTDCSDATSVFTSIGNPQQSLHIILNWNSNVEEILNPYFYLRHMSNILSPVLTVRVIKAHQPP